MCSTDRRGLQDLSAFDDAQLQAALVELTRATSRIAAERLRVVAEISRRADDERARLTLQRAGRLTSGQAAREARLARAMSSPGLAPTARALGDGRISLDQAQVLAQAAQSHPALLAAGQDELLEQAASLDDRAFRVAMADRRHAADPAPEELRARRQFQARQLAVSALPDGMVRVDGLLDPVGGATVRTALDALSPPDPATVPEVERRTPGQRMADALVQLARRALVAGDDAPATSGLRPTTTVFVSPETLDGEDGAAAATLDWVGQICGETARRIACDAEVVRRVVDRGGRTVALDVRRFPTRAQRLAVIDRDRTCRFSWPDGTRCDRPWQWTDVHHVEHHAEGGPTSVANLALLCGRHHHAVHEGGWLVTGTPDAALTFHPPLAAPHRRPISRPPPRARGGGTRDAVSQGPWRR